MLRVACHTHPRTSANVLLLFRSLHTSTKKPSPPSTKSQKNRPPSPPAKSLKSHPPSPPAKSLKSHPPLTTKKIPAPPTKNTTISKKTLASAPTKNTQSSTSTKKVAPPSKKVIPLPPTKKPPPVSHAKNIPPPSVPPPTPKKTTNIPPPAQKKKETSEEVPFVNPLRATKKKWGLFGDIHFDDRTLPRVIKTAEWIAQTFKDQGVTQIICMGDVLNTREMVSVQSLSAATRFFDQLSLIAPVHVILGNHDMNLKHSGKLSSLDVLDMRDLRQRITLHRSISSLDIEGIPCAMIPYQENASVILEWIEENKKENLKNRVAFAHLSLEGAIQRYQRDNKTINTKNFHADQPHATPSHASPTHPPPSSRAKAITTITPRSMQAFKRVFSGHFHHHHSPAENFVYVGAPMQHTYGDAGDDARGVVLYTPSSNNFQFLRNPNWDAFRIIRVTSEEDLEQAQTLANTKQLTNKFVNMLYTGQMSMNARKIDSVHAALLKNGALEVRKALATSFLSKQQKSVVAPTIVHHSPEAVVPAYVAMALAAIKSDDAAWKDEAIKLGQAIISEVTKKEKTNRLQWAGETFAARLVSVTMENFLGVRESLIIPMDSMRDGVWFLTGANGSGKSTLLEAVTWCLFDRFLRSDMKSDFAVNDTTKKNCVVRIAFDNGYEVERFRKHKEKGNGLKIYKNGKYLSELERGNTRDSQKVLEGLLGISFEAFTKAVVLGDNASMNFLMSDSKRRREIIEELLEMDIFDLFLTEVRERKKLMQLSVTQDAVREESILREIQARDEELQRGTATRQSLAQQQKTTQESSVHIEHEFNEWKEKAASLKETEKNWAERRNEQRVLDKWELHQSATQARQLAANVLDGIQKQLAELKTTQQQLVSMRAQENAVHETSALLAELQGPKLTQVQADIAKNEQRIVEVRNQKAKMEELINGGKCPTCQQKVTGTAMHKPVQELEAQLAAATSDLNKSIASKAALANETAAATAALSRLLPGTTLQEFKDKIAKKSQVDEKIESLGTEVRRHTENIAAMPDPAQVLKELQMPIERIKSIVSAASSKPRAIDTESSRDPAEALAAHQSHHASLVEEKFRIQAELKRLQAALEEAEHKHNEVAEIKMTLETELEEIQEKREGVAHQMKLLEFWEKGFDKRTLKSAEYPTMRSYMLAQSVEDLNSILAQYSHIVGSHDRLGITFNSDLELNEDFGKRSAGQRKRNDIVIMLSLFELIRQRGRFRADFVMLDEVFDALDVNGQLQVQELLTMLTERVSKVFVITHSQPHLMSKDANVIQVQMTPNGTNMDLIGQTMY
eukprot:Phypoly_transcript_00731.p1 GENE.Phypoly_transcript_00731~~Phypoly_transcript_00731.p1  ORF type:complete len:1306 (+),score=375.13 Phypoly_transcript_00731:96-4013(+)